MDFRVWSRIDIIHLQHDLVDFLYDTEETLIGYCGMFLDSEPPFV